MPAVRRPSATVPSGTGQPRCIKGRMLAHSPLSNLSALAHYNPLAVPRSETRIERISRRRYSPHGGCSRSYRSSLSSKASFNPVPLDRQAPECASPFRPTRVASDRVAPLNSAPFAPRLASKDFARLRFEASIGVSHRNDSRTRRANEPKAFPAE